MASVNILQQVKTYNRDRQLYGFQNQNCFVSKVCNHKYNDAHRGISKNLGDTISIFLPSGATSGNGLIVSTHPIYQNIAELPIIGAAYSAISATDQERIFNLNKEGFWEQEGRAMAEELGSKVEIEVAKHITGSATNLDPKSPNYGQMQVNSGPTRFVDFISTGLLTYQALAQSQSDWLTMGAPSIKHEMVLPTNYYPPIIGSGLGQFVPRRNDSIAQSWEVGTFGTPMTTYHSSNNLPDHIAGALGIADTTLTITATNDPTGVNVTELTMSGAGAQTNAVKVGDMGYFLAASGIRATTFRGHAKTNQLVQFRVIESADSTGGNVVVKIVTGTYTQGQGLNSSAGHPLQNISGPIVLGSTTVKFLPSHKCGLRVAGNMFYLAMPRLTDLSPYQSSIDTDKDTQVSLRMYHAPIIGQNENLLVNDTIWGALLVPRGSQRICLPLDGNVAAA